jgi:hypothetical protein
MEAIDRIMDRTLGRAAQAIEIKGELPAAVEIVTPMSVLVSRESAPGLPDETGGH